jgi:putative flippase GtrA
VKFGIVGVIAFCIDYGLLIALTELAGIDYLISATLSFTVSVVFNYFASMRYVFRRRENMARHREFTIFVVLSVVGLLLNDVFLWLGTSLLAIDYRITKIAVTALVMAWNFITRKLFLEAR